MPVSEGIKRGTIVLLLLTLLEDQDMYGYQLAQELANRSNGKYTLQESSMYPTLYKLLDKGFISDRQEKAGKRRVRVYYHLEPVGRAHLAFLREEYLSITSGILSILQVEELRGSGE